MYMHVYHLKYVNILHHHKNKHNMKQSYHFEPPQITFFSWYRKQGARHGLMSIKSNHILITEKLDIKNQIQKWCAKGCSSISNNNTLEITNGVLLSAERNVVDKFALGIKFLWNSIFFGLQTGHWSIFILWFEAWMWKVSLWP